MSKFKKGAEQHYEDADQSARLHEGSRRDAKQKGD
jgi:hypothetical protein